MSMIDFVLAFVMVIFIAAELKRGGVKQISGFIGFFSSLLCFFLLYFTFVNINVADSDFFFFVGIIIPIMLYAFIKINLDYRLEFTKKGILFKIFDKVCGAITGLAKGLFVVILTVSLTATMPKWLGWHSKFMNYALTESAFYRNTFPYNPAVYLKLYLFYREESAHASAFANENIKEFLNSAEIEQLVQTKNFIMFCHNEKTNAIKDSLETLKQVYCYTPEEEIKPKQP